MKHRTLRVQLLAALIFATCWGADVSGASAQSCITNIFSGMSVNASARNVHLTIHTKNHSWVSYTDAAVYRSSSTTLSALGSGQQVFSDRQCDGPQWPNFFCYNRNDEQQVEIRSNGQLIIHNMTWGFTTTLNVSCPGGSMMTASDSSAFYVLSYGPVVAL